MFRRLAPAARYIPAGALKIADRKSSAIVYLYTSKQGKLCALGYHGKSNKSDWHFNFSTEARREARCREHFERIHAWESRRVDDRTKRKAFVHNVQVGDIYRTSWGYDQTNVEFFEVVEVKGKYAILREISCAVRQDGQGCESVVAQSGAFLEPRYKGDDQGLPIRRLIQDGHIKIDDVRSAWPWGTRVAGVVVGESAYRTAAGWGH